jgi:hypothetical protein
MAPRLAIVAPNFALQNTSVQVVVSANGAEPGELVYITLTQWNGIAPLWGPESKSTPADAAGDASVRFTIQLAGPTVASLVASGIGSAGTYFQEAWTSIEVL